MFRRTQIYLYMLILVLSWPGSASAQNGNTPDEDPTDTFLNELLHGESYRDDYLQFVDVVERDGVAVGVEDGDADTSSILRAYVTSMAQARLDSPDAYGMFEKFLEPADWDQQYWARRQALGAEGQRHARREPPLVPAALPRFDLPLLSEEYRDAVEAHREAYEHADSVTAEFLEQLVEIEAGPHELAVFWGEYQGALQSLIPDWENDPNVAGVTSSGKRRWIQALVATQPQASMSANARPLSMPGLPDLDPSYRLHWEETLLTTDSWRVKSRLMHVITDFDHPDSVIAMHIFARQITQALEAGQLSQRSARSYRGAVLYFVVQHGSHENAILTADLLVRLNELDPEWNHNRRIGSGIQKNMENGWQEALEALAQDPDTAHYAELLLEAIPLSNE